MSNVCAFVDYKEDKTKPKEAKEDDAPGDSEAGDALHKRQLVAALSVLDSARGTHSPKRLERAAYAVRDLVQRLGLDPEIEINGYTFTAFAWLLASLRDWNRPWVVPLLFTLDFLRAGNLDHWLPREGGEAVQARHLAQTSVAQGLVSFLDKLHHDVPLYSSPGPEEFFKRTCFWEDSFRPCKGPQRNEEVQWLTEYIAALFECPGDGPGDCYSQWIWGISPENSRRPAWVREIAPGPFAVPREYFDYLLQAFIRTHDAPFTTPLNKGGDTLFHLLAKTGKVRWFLRCLRESGFTPSDVDKFDKFKNGANMTPAQAGRFAGYPFGPWSASPVTTQDRLAFELNVRASSPEARKSLLCEFLLWLEDPGDGLTNDELADVESFVVEALEIIFGYLHVDTTFVGPDGFPSNALHACVFSGLGTKPRVWPNLQRFLLGKGAKRDIVLGPFRGQTVDKILSDYPASWTNIT